MAQVESDILESGMNDSSLLEEISRAAGQLDLAGQHQVLRYIRTLENRPVGAAPAAILRFAGTLSEEDGLALQQVIDEGCGRVDHGIFSKSRI
jgi:hypothetical protein